MPAARHQELAALRHIWLPGEASDRCLDVWGEVFFVDLSLIVCGLFIRFSSIFDPLRFFLDFGLGGPIRAPGPSKTDPGCKTTPTIVVLP